MQGTLNIGIEEFYKNLSALIASGVVFTATETNGTVTIEFTGGY
ncbi:hypothetical protein UFOVP606_30 [uncultured Caudovirales phage]|uniref:Uncharacterized protein n=1 Tax=uncultured Caudovirales phage TaxID=2100421 RepID=A0A6J5MZX4_9CAUD|nr:hypothetical protein UFOVP606_30 [uncultured Caudovirales phage]